MSKKRQKNQDAETKKRSVARFILMVFSRVTVRVALYALVVAIFSYGIAKAFEFGYSIFTVDAMESGDGTDVIVTIEEGMTNAQVGELLASKGLVEDATTFVVQAKLYTSARYQIQPGTYTLKTSQTPEEMLKILTVEPEVEEESEALLFVTEEEEE